MKRHAIVLMRWHAMARRGNEEANEGALGRVCHALCMGHHRRRSAPPYRHLNQISVDLNGLRHRPGGQANRREKWVHEAKRGAKYTARVTLGRLSHAPSRALSSPLVDVAVHEISHRTYLRKGIGGAWSVMRSCRCDGMTWRGEAMRGRAWGGGMNMAHTRV